MIELKKDGLSVELCRPGEYYLGTRFDRGGVFRRIVKDDYVFADEWFDHQDPYRHDRVCGPSEEFVTVDFDGVAPGDLFCKPGVGLLRRPDDAPYDWFQLYEVVDPGLWLKETRTDYAEFIHTLPGWYKYTKRISLPDSSGIVIHHEMDWQGSRPLRGFFYNHNFFTFDGTPPGPGRRISFPWTPTGDWRSAYDNVRFTTGGIEFRGPVDPANNVYCGNLHNTAGPTTCEFEISEGIRSVKVSGDMPLDHYVFWSNNRVACPEPYMPISLDPWQTARWTYSYRFNR